MNTSKGFMRGRFQDDEFEGQDRARKEYESIARSGGVNHTGKKYSPQLAKYRGDPRGWYSDRDDVERTCRERGDGLEGMISVDRVVEDAPNPLDEPYRVCREDAEREVAFQHPGESMTIKKFDQAVEDTRDKLSAGVNAPLTSPLTGEA